MIKLFPLHPIYIIFRTETKVNRNFRSAIHFMFDVTKKWFDLPLKDSHSHNALIWGRSECDFLFKTE